MAGPGLTLTLHDHGKFNAAVEGVIDFIGKLDKAFDNIVDKIEKVEASFKQSANHLDNYGTHLDNFAKSIKAVPAQNLESLAKALKSLNRVKFGDISSGLKQISLSMTQLAGMGQAANLTPGSFNITGLTQMFSIIESIGNIIPRKTQIDNVGRAARLARTIIPVIEALDEVAQAFRRVGGVEVDASTERRIRSNINANIRIIRATQDFVEMVSKFPTERPNDTAPQAILNQIRTFADFSRAIERLLTSLDAVIFDTSRVNSISALIRAIRNIVEEFRNFEEILPEGGRGLNVRRLNDIASVITQMSSIIRHAVVMFEASDVIQDPSQLARVRQSTATLIRGVVSVVSEFDRLFRLQLDTGTPERLQDVLQGIEPIARLLRRMLNVLTDMPQAGNFPAVAQGVRDLLTSIPELINVFRDIERVALPTTADDPLNALGQVVRFVFGARTRLTRFFQGIKPLARLLAQVATILAQIPNMRNIGNIGNLFRSINEIVTAFMQIDQATINMTANDPLAAIGAVTSFMIESRTRLTRFFQGIIPLARLLRRVGNILGGIQNIEGIGAVAKVFESIRQLVAVMQQIETVIPQLTPRLRIPLTGVLQRMTRLTRMFQGIIPLARLMRKAARSMGRLRGNDLKSVQVMAQFIQSLSQIIAQSDQLSESGIQNLRNAIQSIIRDIEQGFSQGLASAEGFEQTGLKGGRGFLRGFKRALRIASPSQAMLEFGRLAFEGFRAGINAGNQMANLGLRLGKLFAMSFSRALVDGLRSAAATVSREYRQIGQNLTQIGQQMFATGSRALFFGGVAGFLGSQAISTTADFGQTLKTIQVFGDLTDESLGVARTAIEDFAAATKFNSNQAALAFLDLQKAGLSVRESMAALPRVGELATAGLIPIEEASALAIRVMNGFNLEIQDLTRINDALVGAADISTASISDIGQAMSFAAPNARALGISIEELSAAIALNTDRGLEATRAGTGLRVLFDSLAAPTEGAQKALNELGVTVKDDVTGNFVGLPELIRDFESAITRLRDQGLGDVDIFELLAPLGDQNAITALLNLLGEGDLDAYIEALENANSAQEVAEAQMDTFKGAVISLSGSIANLKNRALLPLLEGPLKRLAEDFTVLVNTIAALPQPVLSAVAALALAATTIITLSGAALVLGSIISLSLGPAFRTLGVFAAIYANPIQAIITTLSFISGLAGSLVILTAIGATFAAIGTAATAFFVELRNDAAAIREELARLEGVFIRIVDAVVGIGQGVIIWLEQTGIKIGGLEDIATHSFGIVSGAISTVTDALKPVAMLLEDILFMFQAFAAVQAPERFNEVFGDEFLANVEVETPYDNVIAEIEDELAPGNVFEQIERNVNDVFGLGEQRTITIAPGDTLTGIANEYGTTVERLLELNQLITDPNLILAGEELVVAAGTSDQVQQLNNEYDKLIKKQEEFRQQQIEQMNAAELFAMRMTETATFIRIFGEGDEAARKFTNTIIVMDAAARITARGLQGVITAIQLMLGGEFDDGLEELQIGFGNLSLGLLTFVEHLFGFDIGDQLRRALVQGNLAIVVGLITTTLGDLFLDGIAGLAPFIGLGIELAIKGFLGAPSFILAELLGITFLEPIKNLIFEIAGVGGEFAQSFVTNVVDVLRGDQNIAQAVNNISNDVSEVLKDSPILTSIGDFLGLTTLDLSGVRDELNETIGIITNIPNLKEFERFNDELNNLANKILPGFGKQPANAGSSVIEEFIRTFNSILEPAIPVILRSLTGALKLFGTQLDRIGDTISESDFAANLVDTLQLLAGILLIFKGPVLVLGFVKFAAAWVAFSIAVEAADEWLETLAIIKNIIGDLITLDFKGAASQLDDFAISIINLGGAIIKGIGNASFDIAQLILDAAGIDKDARETLKLQWEQAGFALEVFFRWLSLKLRIWTSDIRETVAGFIIDLVGNIDVLGDALADATGRDEFRFNVSDGIASIIGTPEEIRDQREQLEREFALFAGGFEAISTPERLVQEIGLDTFDIEAVADEVRDAPDDVIDAFNENLDLAIARAEQQGDTRTVNLLLDLEAELESDPDEPIFSSLISQAEVLLSQAALEDTIGGFNLLEAIRQSIGTSGDEAIDNIESGDLTVSDFIEIVPAVDDPELLQSIRDTLDDAVDIAIENEDEQTRKVLLEIIWAIDAQTENGVPFEEAIGQNVAFGDTTRGEVDASIQAAIDMAPTPVFEYPVELQAQISEFERLQFLRDPFDLTEDGLITGQDILSAVQDDVIDANDFYNVIFDIDTAEGAAVLEEAVLGAIELAAIEQDADAYAELFTVSNLITARFTNVEGVVEEVVLTPDANIRGLLFDAGELEVDITNIPAGEGFTLSDRVLFELSGGASLADEAVANEEIRNAIADAAEVALQEGVSLTQVALDLEAFGLSPEAVQLVIDEIDKSFVPEEFTAVGENVNDGISNGITGSANVTAEAGRELANMLDDAITTVLQIQSPSMLMFQRGQSVVKGLSNGITQNISMLQNAVNIIALQFDNLNTRLGIAADNIRRTVSTLANDISLAMAQVQGTVNQAQAQAQPGVGGGLGQVLSGVPSFNDGGFTGRMTMAVPESFIARLHRGEYVVPQGGALAVRNDGMSGAVMALSSSLAQMNAIMSSKMNPSGDGQSVNVNFNGDVNIGSNDNVTPEVIADGMQRWVRQNPPQREFRDYQ